MKKSRFSDSQIIEAIKRVETSLPFLSCAGTGHQLGHVLQMAFQIRRHGRIAAGVSNFDLRSNSASSSTVETMLNATMP